MKPVLFILEMPFKTEKGNIAFCTHCALIEGALLVNPHWEDEVDVWRIRHSKPRREVIEILGEENQWLPVLILESDETITDPIKITEYLYKKYGGAVPYT